MKSISRPRIAIDARMVGSGGIGRYTESLLTQMMRQRPQVRWTLIGRPESLKHFEGAEIRECRAGVYSAVEAFGIAGLFKDADLVHIPHFNAPFMIRPRLVVTVHDLIHFEYPEYQPFPCANALLDFKLKRLLRRADRVVTVSSATAAALERRYPDLGLTAKTRVIWEAADASFGPEPQLGDLETCKKYGIKGKYFLYVGAIREHKEVHTLMSAFAAVQASEAAPVQLLLSGRLDARFEKKHRFTEWLSRNPGAAWARSADDQELAALYRGALAVVLPSQIEGFGLPVLEAMRSGTPMIISDAPSLTEIAGGAALTFKTGQIDPLRDCLYNVMTDSDLRQRLVVSGLRRAADFDWSKTAAQTLEIYDSLL